uniref:(northern house mosquito) hypothetical protein n=1 Tax=Culex pipiens TaxID=7175 RepID=A0A8D8AHA1_CULPI
MTLNQGLFERFMSLPSGTALRSCWSGPVTRRWCSENGLQRKHRYWPSATRSFRFLSAKVTFLLQNMAWLYHGGDHRLMVGTASGNCRRWSDKYVQVHLCRCALKES